MIFYPCKIQKACCRACPRTLRQALSRILFASIGNQEFVLGGYPLSLWVPIGSTQAAGSKIKVCMGVIESCGIPSERPLHVPSSFPLRAQMFKTSVGTLALVAAPPDANPVHEDKLSTAPADATSMDAHLRTGTMLTADDRPEHPDAGGRRVSKSSSSASGAGIVAVDAVPSTRSSWSEQDSGGDRGLPPQAPPLRARASLAALVRPQLELLADLSRAVGHGEAALTCASLLRDEGGVTATLRYIGWEDKVSRQ